MIQLASKADRNESHPRVRLTREGWQFVFMLSFVVFAAILQNVNLLILMSGAFAGILLLQWRLTKRTLVGLEVERTLPSEIEARKTFTATLAVTNPRRWLGSWLVGVHETYRLCSVTDKSTHSTSIHGTLFDRVLPGETTSRNYTCKLEKRGTYEIKSPQVSTLFPFSLMRGTRRIGSDHTLVAIPTLGYLRSGWQESLDLPSSGSNRSHTNQAGQDDEFFSLRDYRFGDSMKLVHWRSSAKRNNLVVRQMERFDPRSIHIVLDLFGSNDDRADLAIEFVATVLFQIVQGHRGGAIFSIVDSAKRSTIVRTPVQLRSCLRLLADLHPNNLDWLPAFFRDLDYAVVRPQTMLLVTTRPNAETWKADTFNAVDFAHRESKLSDTTGSTATLPRLESSKLTVRPLFVGSSKFDQVFCRG